MRCDHRAKWHVLQVQRLRQLRGVLLNQAPRAIRGWRCVRTMPPPPAPATRIFQDHRAHGLPTEHDEEKGKERGRHWLWEGAQSSRAAPRERAIHSDRFTGQCTSRHTTSLLTDGHRTAAVNRTSPPHFRRETKVPPEGSNGFALACGCRRGGGFFVDQLGPAENSQTKNLEKHHLAKIEIVKLSSRKNSQRRKASAAGQKLS